MENKYKCQKCNASFDGVKQYINHLELHKESLVDVPKQKPTLFQRLFGKKTTPKTEEKQMPEPTKTETEKPSVPNNDERISAIERSIAELTTLITAKQTPEAPETTEEVKAPEPPTPDGKAKNIRLTITVNEKNMPELIKEIQENDSYEMENIEVLNK